MTENDSEQQTPPEPPPQPQESPFPKPTMEEIGKGYEPPDKETRDDG